MTRARATSARRLAVLVATALVGIGLPASPYAQTISKCQDAQGHWHYGDFASQACAERSTITELNERGVKVDERNAPPTQEEIEARKERERQARLDAEQEARRQARDQLLLRTYDSAQAIVKARDRRIEALDRTLTSYDLIRQNLNDDMQTLLDAGTDSGDRRVSALEAQIEQYDAAIDGLESERQSILDEYNRDLARYRRLTGKIDGAY